jgi:hypothetical protein
VFRFVFFGIAFLMWLGTMGFGLVEGEGLLFFSLGIWMQKTGFNIQTPNGWLRPLGWGIVFVALAAVKTWLAFTGESFLGRSVFVVLPLMHKVVVLSGLVACWYGLDPLVKWCMARPWFVWLSAFSFMIYAMHAPLIALIIDPVFSLFRAVPYYRIITFVLLPSALIMLSIALGALLRSFMPKVYSLLTGGRGM